MEHGCLHKLKDMSYAELDRISMASEFTPETLRQADQLTCLIKNIQKIEMHDKEEEQKAK